MSRNVTEIPAKLRLLHCFHCVLKNALDYFLFAFFRFVGDCQMNLALKMFIEENGKELLEKNLYRNFVLHVCNLFEFGVLGPGHVFTAISRMQKFVDARNHQFQEWPTQKSHWQKCEELAKLNESKERKTRKDFSGIFKQNINPFVVLSPLSLQHSNEMKNNQQQQSDEEIEEEVDDDEEAALRNKNENSTTTTNNVVTNAEATTTTVKQEEGVILQES